MVISVQDGLEVFEEGQDDEVLQEMPYVDE